MGEKPGTMFGAAPPLMVPMLNVVVPNLGDEDQSTLRRELRAAIRCSIAETPSSGYPLNRLAVRSRNA
jgi:hypothetical protein